MTATHTKTDDSGANESQGKVDEEMVQPAEHSVSAREPVRKDLAADVEAYLSQGGKVESVPKDFRADPPRKPENNYGRGSI